MLQQSDQDQFSADDQNPKGIRNVERTPCMAEEITEHPWTWKEFLMFKAAHGN